MNPLDNLTQSLLSILDTHGEWQIFRDDILDLLGLDIRDVYSRIIASKDPMVDFRTSIYSNDNVGALICLLECFGYKEAPQTFWERGLWIPYEIQVELQEILIEEVKAIKSQHQIDYDTFLSIFDSVSGFSRSLDVYLEEFFSLDEVTGRAIRKLLKSHYVKTLNETELLLQKLARELFRRGIIPYRDLFSDIFIKLKGFLISIGRIKSPRKKVSPIDEAQLNARQLFGYSRDQHIHLKELKQRYKNLMKQYHPDVNPRGLELAKDINRAYSILLPEI